MAFVKPFICLLLVFVIDRCQGDRSKIFNGLREPEPHTYPWVGWLLIGQRRVKCGVVLIADDKALTAASCVTGGIDGVYFGDHIRSDTDGNEQVFSVSSAMEHPDYDAVTYENDVAILMLDRNATMTDYVEPIPLLPNNKATSKVLSKHCRVVGWGYEVAGPSDRIRDQSDVPYEITVDMTDNTTCSDAGAPTMTAICYEPFRDPTSLTCEGDSGGAYMCKRRGTWMLAGIMSMWMVGEGCTDGPRMATTIPSVYDWIISNL